MRAFFRRLYCRLTEHQETRFVRFSDGAVLAWFCDRCGACSWTPKGTE